MDYSLKSAVIVAGGWSVRPEHIAAVNALREPDIICVNDAVFYFERADCVVTMDRKWLMNRYEEVHARRTFIYHRGGAGAVPAHVAHCAFANNNLPGAMASAEHPMRLDGNNSGACALNLAFLRRYHRVFLLGFDMQKGPEKQNHFYDNYAWNLGATKPAALKGWSGSFGEAAKQFQRRGMLVYNVNDRSLIRDFPTVSFEEFRSMTA